MRKLFLIVRSTAVVLAWSLFFFWWKQVLAYPGLSHRTIVFSLVAIALTLSAAVTYSVVWILHNKRLARRGRRGQVSFYRAPRFEKDAIGRNMRLPSCDSPLERVIVVSSTVSTKEFAPEKRVPAAQPDVLHELQEAHR